MQIPSPTWFIGCGNMGGAIVDGWRAAEIDLAPVTVIRPSGRAVEGVRVVSSLADAGAPPKLVVLAFKPQQLDDLAAKLRPLLTAKTVIVSLLAGAEVASLRARFPGAAAIVRMMPNLPVAVRRGVIALYSEDIDDAARSQIGELIAPLGYALWLNAEAKLSAIGSVAGAGPAYAARFIEALAKAAESRGISPEVATVIARETVLGTAWMAATTGEDMASIAKRVASPNGTTQAGLDVLDHGRVLDELIDVTVAAAERRGAELADAARGPSLEEPARLH
jgi:pyrroline-5-carboxylate reductase